jgi:hypothetical protein
MLPALLPALAHSITDLTTSCHAEGRPELAERLARELQAALDALKHGTLTRPGDRLLLFLT